MCLKKESENSMEIIICILGIIIVMLFFYIFLLKKEINRISIQVKDVRNKNSNILLHTELGEKNINELIQEINKTLVYIHNEEIQMHSKTEELRQMITNVAHDIRTPLTSAIGYLELLQNSSLDNKQKGKYFSIITERLNKLSYLITNFFEFSKIISSSNEIEFKKENLIEILENCIAGFYEDFSKENRQIDFIHDTNRLEINTSKTLMIRIIDNLIINAYKHSKSNLEIAIFQDENNIKLQFTNKVENNNLNTDIIFEKFYTADDSRTNGNTGLGLAIAKEFVKLLNGEIYALKEGDLLKIIVKL